MYALLYSNTDQIRSVLGVDIQDLSDSQITDRNIEKELRIDLLSWAPGHALMYDAGFASLATDKDQSISDALNLYCTYYCALLVIKSLQLAAPKAVSDGKNTLSRFDTIDWKGLTAHIKERTAFYRVFVQDSVSVTPVSPVYVLFQGATLVTDPVTTGV